MSIYFPVSNLGSGLLLSVDTLLGVVLLPLTGEPHFLMPHAQFRGWVSLKRNWNSKILVKQSESGFHLGVYSLFPKNQLAHT